MSNATNPKIAQDIIKNLLVVMRNCKKILDHENKMFDSNATTSLSGGGAKVLEKMQQFDEAYRKMMGAKNLPEEALKMAAVEYDLFLESVRQYSVNLKVVTRVNEILMDSIKSSMASSVKHDMGYNKQGKFVSDKTVLSIMPSVTFNNKV